MRRRITHRNEGYGGRWLSITVAMPLDPAIGFAMVGFFLRIGSLMSTIPTHVYGFYLPICLSAYLGMKKITKKQRRKQKTPS